MCIFMITNPILLHHHMKCNPHTFVSFKKVIQTTENSIRTPNSIAIWLFRKGWSRLIMHIMAKWTYDRHFNPYYSQWYLLRPTSTQHLLRLVQFSLWLIYMAYNTIYTVVERRDWTLSPTGKHLLSLLTVSMENDVMSLGILACKPSKHIVSHIRWFLTAIGYVEQYPPTIQGRNGKEAFNFRSIFNSDWIPFKLWLLLNTLVFKVSIKPLTKRPWYWMKVIFILTFNLKVLEERRRGWTMVKV